MMAKRMKSRIVRMRAIGRVNIATCMRPSARRKAQIDEALDKMKMIKIVEVGVLKI